MAIKICRVVLSFKVLFYFSLGYAQLVEVPSQLRRAGNRCVDPWGKETNPISVFNGKEIDTRFLYQMPICSRATTCITQDRLMFLEKEGMLPMGLKNVPSYFNEEKRIAAAMTCLANPKDLQAQTAELEKIIWEKRGSFPYETKMASELTNIVGGTGKDFIKSSRAASQILAQCYNLNAELDKSKEIIAIETDQMKRKRKRELYAQSELRKNSRAAFCDRIWDGPEEEVLERTFQNLRSLRESLFLLNSMQKFRSDKAFLEYIGLVLNPQEASRQPDFPKLNPWGKVWFLENPLYKNTPQQLEPLTVVEQGELSMLIKELNQRYPGLKLKEALLSNINRLISVDPIIIHFEKSKPNSSEVATAMEKYARGFSDESLENNLSDFRFFQYPILVNEVIEDMDFKKRGDACAIAEFIQRRSKEIEDRGLDSVLSLGSLLAFGAGARAVVGLGEMAELGTGAASLARATAFVNAGGLVGMGTMVSHAISRGISMQDEKAMCDTQAQDSKGLCRPEKIVRNMIELQIQGIMLVAAPIIGRAFKKSESRFAKEGQP